MLELDVLINPPGSSLWFHVYRYRSLPSCFLLYTLLLPVFKPWLLFSYTLINQCQSSAALTWKLSGSIIHSNNSQWSAYRSYPPSTDRRKIKIDFTHPGRLCCWNDGPSPSAEWHFPSFNWQKCDKVWLKLLEQTLELRKSIKKNISKVFGRRCWFKYPKKIQWNSNQHKKKNGQMFLIAELSGQTGTGILRFGQ